MNRPARKALIIGCGVAGPVVALFLQRAGIEAEIYEARGESTEYGGSFLNMACNGLGVLKTLGLDDQVSRQDAIGRPHKGEKDDHAHQTTYRGSTRDTISPGQITWNELILTKEQGS